MSTLTAIGSRGKRDIEVGENDLDLLPMLEAMYTDLWDRVHFRHPTEWNNEPFHPNLTSWLAEMIGGLKDFSVVKKRQSERAINFLLLHRIIRVKLFEQDLLGNKVTFLCIDASNIPIIEEWESR